MRTLKLMIYATFAFVLFGAASSVTASALTASTTINSTISSVISVLTTNGTVTLDVIPTGAGAQTIGSDTVTVSTNDPAGYTLQLSTTGASTAMTSGAYSIIAAAGSQASPAAMAVNTWGYRVDGVGGFGAGPTSSASSAAMSSTTFAGVPSNSSPNTIKTTSGTATSDTTTVWYTVAADTSQEYGTYTTSVTYTATAN